MTRRRKALSFAGLWIIAMGAASAWTLAPTKVRADVPQVTAPAPANLWTKGPVDSGNMVPGVLDYRSEPTRSYVG